MQEWWWIALAAVGFFAVVLILNGMITLLGGRWLSGGLRLVIGVGLSWACLALALLGVNLQTYPRTIQGEPLATLSFKRVDQDSFDATLTRPGRQGMIDDVRIYRLSGDHWQLSARTLTWPSWAHPIGLRSHARLEDLSGFQEDEPAVDPERDHAHRLHDGEPEIGFGPFTLPWQPTVWATTQKLAPYIDILTPRIVETSILPMQDEGHYDISLTKSGLKVTESALQRAEIP